MKAGAALALAFSAAACSVIGPPRDPMPVRMVPGVGLDSPPVVVVLPGFIYDEDDLYDVGTAAAIHRGWPEADVLLTGATFNYYRTGLMVPRLHAHIRRLREQGYREIWLIGGSMGGMGVLLYEWHYPGELTGVVLMSPFLGDGDLLDEVREAGGPAGWDPGPLPPEMDADHYQRQVWSMIRGWRERPDLGRRVWLACGTDDHLYPDVRILAPEIPPGQVLLRRGGHDWDYWLPATEEVFRRIRVRAAAG